MKRFYVFKRIHLFMIHRSQNVLISAHKDQIHTSFLRVTTAFESKLSFCVCTIMTHTHITCLVSALLDKSTATVTKHFFVLQF